MKPIQNFTITEDHLKLLKHQHIFITGAPFIPGRFHAALNTSRPFGNSDVYGDMAEILNWPPAIEGEFPKETIIRMNQLLREMAYALQICLCTLSFESGEYYNEDPCDAIGWQKL